MIWTTLFALVGLASPAVAEPLARQDAALSRASGETRNAPDSLDSLDLSLSLDWPSVAQAWELPSIELTLGELPPESLQIEVPVTAWLTAYVVADLDAELPRLDSLDGDTYFAPGIECHITHAVSLFVEDFQPASGVLGDESDETAPDRSWDGHQIALGTRWQPSERVSVEGAAVFYTLSRTHRRSGVGALASLTLSF